MTATTDSFLDIRELSKSYGDSLVLDRINLQLNRGAVVCLIGSNGSGKSTLLRTVNRLESVDSGMIFFDGQEITGHHVDENQLRKRIAMVFQSFNLFPHMTVLKNITLGPRVVHGKPTEEANQHALELLARFGLEGKAHVRPDQLSGGQQQRVAIVRALASEPDLLLLDEITSALDPELVGEVLNIIRELKDSGMTILMATHEMGFAREVSTKICFLDQGSILEEGPPEQLFGSPRQPRTQQFLQRITEAGRL